VNPTSDVFGRALFDWAKGGTQFEVLERDDGFTQEGAGPGVYLAGFREWPACERQSVRHLRGRVLDIGCGAGRVALELQRRGLDVVGLDASPLAARAAKLRGVQEVWNAPLHDLKERIASFDALIFYGNNFGIFANPSNAHRQLAMLARHTKDGAKIFMESTSSYFGGAPAMTRPYYAQNLLRGRAPGQVRVRYRYDDMWGKWFDWVYVSPREMRHVLRGTGWRQERILASTSNEPYVAILTKEKS